MAARVHVRIAGGGGDFGGAAVGFLQAHDIGIRQADRLDHLGKADLIATIPDVEAQDFQACLLLRRGR